MHSESLAAPSRSRLPTVAATGRFLSREDMIPPCSTDLISSTNVHPVRESPQATVVRAIAGAASVPVIQTTSRAHPVPTPKETTGRTVKKGDIQTAFLLWRRAGGLNAANGRTRQSMRRHVHEGDWKRQRTAGTTMCNLT